MFIAIHGWASRVTAEGNRVFAPDLPGPHDAELPPLALDGSVANLRACCRSGLASEPLGPLNRIHALGFLAALIEAARFVKGSLGRSHILGGGSPGTFRLLSCRGPAADLALHVLGRSGASLRRLSHGSGWRMLFTGARVRR
jgi:hypothetical protein